MSTPRKSLPLAECTAAIQWAAIIVLSALAGGALEAARFPGALLLGPLAAAAFVKSAGGSVRTPKILIVSAQALIGCLIARAITPSILSDFGTHWPVFLTAVTLSLTGALAIGWSIGRLGVIPGGTAVWGMLPGAATAMIVMAEAHGADFRLVAFMQYVRVAIVALVASLVAVVFVHSNANRFAHGYFPPIDVCELRRNDCNCRRRRSARLCIPPAGRRAFGSADSRRVCERRWFGENRIAACRSDR